MAVKANQIGRTTDLPAQVASKILAEVMAGRLKPGQRLPTEPELSDVLGVSRTVVREAVVRLKADGVLRSKQGSGVFVCDSMSDAALRIDRVSLLDRDMFKSFYELRTILESNAAGLAAERRDKKSLAAIAAVLNDLGRLSGNDVASVDGDLAFHYAIAQATGNPMVATFVRFISLQVRESIIETRMRGDPERSKSLTNAEHLAIFEAISAGDAAAARAAMSIHINHGAERLGVL